MQRAPASLRIRYVNADKKPELLCNACVEPLVRPITLPECSHTVCADCARVHVEASAINGFALAPAPVKDAMKDDGDDDENNAAAAAAAAASSSTGDSKSSVTCPAKDCSVALPADIVEIFRGAELAGEKLNSVVSKYSSDAEKYAELDALPVKCSNVANGCSWTGVRKDLEDHLNSCTWHSCGLAPSLCAWVGTKRDAFDHPQCAGDLVVLKCTHRSLGCMFEVASREAMHVQEHWPAYQRFQQMVERGEHLAPEEIEGLNYFIEMLGKCNLTETRRAMDLHESMCVYGEVVRHRQQFAQVNEVVRRLEGRVAALERELDGSKGRKRSLSNISKPKVGKTKATPPAKKSRMSTGAASKPAPPFRPDAQPSANGVQAVGASGLAQHTDDDDSDEFCSGCRDGGVLVVCDSGKLGHKPCKRTFHEQCLLIIDPSGKIMPPEDDSIPWQCPICTGFVTQERLDYIWPLPGTVSAPPVAAE